MDTIDPGYHMLSDDVIVHSLFEEYDIFGEENENRG